MVWGTMKAKGNATIKPMSQPLIQARKKIGEKPRFTNTITKDIQKDIISAVETDIKILLFLFINKRPPFKMCNR